jgi:hypothetical protein
MFFRIKQLKSGNVLQLVESYRNDDNQPRQRLVVSLGSADIPKLHWREVAERVEAKLYSRPEQPYLDHDDAEALSNWVRLIVNRIQRDGKWMKRCTDTEPQKVIDGVVAENVTHSNTAILGPSLLGRHAWEQLGMDDLLGNLGMNRSQRDCAAALVINRLCDPVSVSAAALTSADSTDGNSFLILLLIHA